VAAFAGIYPVCNIAGWNGVNLGNYGINKDELADRLKEFNPIDRLEKLAHSKRGRRNAVRLGVRSAAARDYS
jgi:hypothetical protein